MDSTPSGNPVGEPKFDRLSDHCYDGIQEYDNPTPGWWNWLFLGSIAFTPFYLLWFHSPTVERTLSAQYDMDLAANMKLQFGELGTLAPDEPTLLKYIKEPNWLKVGQATFATNCAACHGRAGEGVSAPNMTDDHYLHVKQVTDIAKVIQEGAKAGAMPAWGNRLHPNEVVLAAAYVASLRGQNLPSARPAEGPAIDPWPETRTTN